jgi:mRNA interferase MazF
MSVQRGAIILVDYPYSDRTGSKIRPALVIQSDQLNQTLADTIIVLVSSSKTRFVGAPSQLVVDVTTPDGLQSGLRQRSVVQCENLVTIDQSFVLRTIGRLSPAMMQINNCLKATLGIL